MVVERFNVMRILFGGLLVGVAMTDVPIFGAPESKKGDEQRQGSYDSRFY